MALIVKYKNLKNTLGQRRRRTNSTLSESDVSHRMPSAKDKIWVKSDGTSVDMNMVTMVVDAALQDLAANYPSVEKILKHKDIIYTDHPQITTMATDGVSIFINPAFAEYLIKMGNDGPKYLEFVLIHEALHVLFDHCGKSKNTMDKFSDFEKINLAQDYEINYIIENFMREGLGSASFKGVTNQIGGCYNEEYGKKGLTWEEIYDQIPKITRQKQLMPTSDEWKKGFTEGYKKAMDSLRKRNLVEQCVMM